MNISEEDLAIAGLAKLVGSNLNEIDKFTVQSKNGPANKIDPRQFLTGKQLRPQNKQVVHHDGHAFYNGVDESVVQGLYPEPASTVPQVAPRASQPPLGRAVQKSTEYPAVVIAPENAEFQDTLIKTLKSIDKTLKALAKTLQPTNK